MRRRMKGGRNEDGLLGQKTEPVGLSLRLQLCAWPPGPQPYPKSGCLSVSPPIYYPYMCLSVCLSVLPKIRPKRRQGSSGVLLLALPPPLTTRDDDRQPMRSHRARQVPRDQAGTSQPRAATAQPLPAEAGAGRLWRETHPGQQNWFSQ